MSTYASQLLVAGVSLAHVMVVARTLGPEGRGQTVLLTTIAGLVGFCCTMSAQEAMANLYGVDASARRSIVTNAFVLAGAFGALGMLVAFSLIAAVPSMHRGLDDGAIAIALLAIPVIVLHTYLIYLVRAAYAYTVANVAAVVAALWNFLVDGTLAALGELSVFRVIMVWTLSQVLTAGVLAGYLVTQGGLSRPNRRLLSSTVTFGMKAHGAGLMNTGSYRLDQWILGALGGTSQLGLYSVAVAWCEGLFILPGALAMVARPVIVGADDEDARRYAERFFRVGLAVTVLLAVCIALAAPWLCVLVFGEEFRGSITLLRLLAPGAVGVAVVKILGGALTARGRPWLETIAVGIGFGAGTLLYVVLIPPFDAVGAAVASTAAYSIAGVATAVVFLRGLGGRPRELLGGTDDLAFVRAALFRRRQPAP